jgi:hypothetical protein
VVNKCFKAGIRSAFGDHLHILFEQHVASGAAPALFKPSLNTKELKPKIGHFIECGMDRIRAPHMAYAIRNAFATKAFVNDMRTAALEKDAAVTLLTFTQAAELAAEFDEVAVHSALDDTVMFDDIDDDASESSDDDGADGTGFVLCEDSDDDE